MAKPYFNEALFSNGWPNGSPNPIGNLTRRHLLLGIAAGAVLLVPGYSRGAETNGPEMMVYREPTCGCCEKWAALASRAGFNVRVVNRLDMQDLKRQLGIPTNLTSCHTAVVDGFLVEGHVPMEDIQRLLKQRPAVRGIAVPGMPVGSPGMEVPDGTKEAFQVIAFNSSGRFTSF